MSGRLWRGHSLIMRLAEVNTLIDDVKSGPIKQVIVEVARPPVRISERLSQYLSALHEYGHCDNTCLAWFCSTKELLSVHELVL